MQPIIVTTTCDNRETAASIAEEVLKHRLAACVQVIGPIQSSYWWDGRISVDQEYQIQMKSEASLFRQLSPLIRSLHPYEVAEIVATEICAIDEDYKSWMIRELSFEK